MNRRSLVIFGVLLGAAACGNRAPETIPPIENPAHVAVTNHYGLPMEIYVSGSGINHRLGLVHPGMSTEYTIPQNLMGGSPVFFEARPAARGPLYRSGEIMLSPGTIVDFTVAQVLFSSNVVIRP